MSTHTDMEEARMYASEKEENFRWLSRWLGTTSSIVLTAQDRVPESLQTSLHALGEFAEIAHGSIDPSWVLNEKHRRVLGSKGMPLELYPTISAEIDGKLEPVEFIERFHGSRGDLQGYCALRLRPRTSFSGITERDEIPRPQLILAFSGTSNPKLAMYDVMAAAAGYQTSYSDPLKSTWRVHDGFQRVYQGVKSACLETLRKAIVRLEKEHDNLCRQANGWDLVITAHSLGAAIGYLLWLDLMHADATRDKQANSSDSNELLLPKDTNVCLAFFGCPRVANPQLTAHYRDQVTQWRQRRSLQDSLIEWSIIAHLDGVPALPPAFFGYNHFSDSPMYLYSGRLYKIPSSESEHSKFTVEDSGSPVIHPKGGHNYYSVRDMEQLQRRLKAIFSDLLKKESSPSSPKSRRSKSSSTGTKQSSGSEQVSQGSNRNSRQASTLATTPEKFSGFTIGPTSKAVRDQVDLESPQRLTTEPDEVETTPEWVENYLERERTWKVKVDSQLRWKSLGSLVKFGVIF